MGEVRGREKNPEGIANPKPLALDDVRRKTRRKGRNRPFKVLEERKVISAPTRSV